MRVNFTLFLSNVTNFINNFKKGIYTLSNLTGYLRTKYESLRKLAFSLIKEGKLINNKVILLVEYIENLATTYEIDLLATT